MSQAATEVQDAEQAFIDSLPSDTMEGASVDGAENKPDAPDAAETAAPATTDEGTTEQDSFTRTDLDALLADIQDPTARAAVEKAYKGFQGDYTRKMQDVAPIRQALGDVDPSLAAEAVQFYTNLQNDPAFAMEVHEYLTNAFEQMGLTPGQAAQAASEELENQTREAAKAVAPPADGEDPDEYLKSQVDRLNERLATFEQREAERLARQEEDELAANLLQQEMALRQSDTKLKEADLDRIYDLALTTGGNLFEAHKTYMDWKNDVIQDYASQKTTVTDRVDSPSASPAQPVRETPRTARGDVDLEAVHREAMQRLFNKLGQDSG